MRAYSFSKAETVRENTVTRFGGVDFETHPTKVELSRSPDMKNMLAGETHFLVKRPGYKRVCTLEAPVYGLFALPGDDGAALCHAGAAFYYLAPDGTATLLREGAAEAFSSSFVMGGRLFLLDGTTFWVARKEGDGIWAVSPVADEAFVPTTTISAPPAGGGTSYEAVNLLTPKRINTFIGNGSATQFYLDAKDIDTDAVTATVGGSAVTVSSVNRATGVVTLAAAPANGNGLANVTITFSKTVDGYADKINKCRVAGLYGGKNDTRVFLAGNPDEPACDWQSGLYDPTYFPDTGYTRIGTDASAIMGYVKQYESQVVIKEGGAQEATQYLRSYLMADDGTALYPLKQGAQGAGAVSMRCFGNLSGLPLFLAADGVMAVYGTGVAEQRTVRPAGRPVAPRMAAETGLANACAAVFEDKYYLAVNGRCYVADGRISGEDGAPEWYYWDHIPAQCFAVVGDTLLFGAFDGRVCRFCKADEENAYSDDGAAIDAYWRTPVLSLGSWSSYKELRDFYPVLMPYTRSGAEVSYDTDGAETVVLSQNLDLFSFHTFDFSRLSFRCRPGAMPFRTRRRLRRVGTVQLRVRNNRPGEPFGLLALALRWTPGQSVKA
ncbi:MAG: hypothetical protein AB7C89_08850 [Intestinibacillus sp.]